MSAVLVATVRLEGVEKAILGVSGVEAADWVMVTTKVVEVVKV